MLEVQFLGVPEVGPWLFSGLALASFATTFLGIIVGTAGGLALLAIMALFFPPAVLVPVHTVVMLGAGSSRVVIMWRHVLRGTLLPFLIGSAFGAAIGAGIFVSLPSGILQLAIGGLVLLLTWLPRFALMGTQAKRFAAVGFGSTFLGVFVSATGTLVAPFVASASPSRHNHAATLAALMTIVHVMKLIAFGIAGVAFAAYAPLMVAMIAAAALGNWAGFKALDHVPERLFRIVFQLLVTALALRLLWTGMEALA